MADCPLDSLRCSRRCAIAVLLRAVRCCAAVIQCDVMCCAVLLGCCVLCGVWCLTRVLVVLVSCWNAAAMLASRALMSPSSRLEAAGEPEVEAEAEAAEEEAAAAAAEDEAEANEAGGPARCSIAG